MLNATPLLKAYARFRCWQLARQNPVEAQLKQLFRLLHKARLTRFGRDHSFENISSVIDYQRCVPLRKWEDFWTEYWEQAFPFLNYSTWPGQVNFFTVSSGTTSGGTKYFPYTPELRRSNIVAGMDILVHHLANCPKSKVLGGKCFMLGGSTDLVEQAPGIFSGDLSGISNRELPTWVRPFFFPPVGLAKVSDWEQGISRMAIECVNHDIRMVAGVPAWMLILFEKVRAHLKLESVRLIDLFPKLELLVYGGVRFDPYLERFKRLLDGSQADLREVYPASEAFMAVADRGPGDGMRLVLDHGVFFEFVPVEELEAEQPTRHWIANVETGINYAVVLTTCGGVWSYVLGDTVKFVDTKPHRILFTGRTAYYMSAWGEHLIEDEVQRALRAASEAKELSITDFALGAIHPEKDGKLGHHLYVIEFETPPDTDAQLEGFVEVLDQTLCNLNDDYRDHSKHYGYGMEMPQVLVAKPGSFEAWMKNRGKHGGQNKVPRFINDQEVFSGLVDFMDKY